MANRIWQHHFGRGIVRSPNNFGSLGDPPTHPELLDWLASDWSTRGWRIKPLHRLIMLSSTYRMSSRRQRAGAGRRSDERSVLAVRHAAAERRGTARFDAGGRRPVESEDVRAGHLSRDFGRGAGRPVAARATAGANRRPEEQARRSIYIHVKRSLITPLLASFDFPDTDISCEARFATTQPDAGAGHAQRRVSATSRRPHLAERLRREAGDDPAARIAPGRCGWPLAAPPTADEITRGARS